MRDVILNSIDQPEELEKLYRKNRAVFKNAFIGLYPEIQGRAIAQAWHARLVYSGDDISWGRRGELMVVIGASLVAGLVAKIPDFFGIDQEYFYSRNISFIVLPLLAAYFAWKQKLSLLRIMTCAVLIMISVFYVNFLPHSRTSDTLVLACVHLPLFLWTVVGFVFVGDSTDKNLKRLEFLRYNGDLVVMTAIILIAGGLLTAVTVGLFSLIDNQIVEFYFQNIVICGLAAVPLVATFLVQVNPQLVGKVSPVIAKIFTPLVLIMLLTYLFFIMYIGKNPYQDREFLIVFNMLLVGVMAIILFSIVGDVNRDARSKTDLVLLFALSVVTIVVNGIALSAIVFRISEWGITPNRLAVTGSNILMLANLVTVAWHLLQVLRNGNDTEHVGRSIAWFLPVYSIWTAWVVFVFPVLFGFR